MVDRITNLQIETEHTDGRAVLSVAGEIDLASAPQFREALAPLVAEESPVTIDLGDVTFMDSSGLHVLFTLALSTNGSGPMKVVNPSRAILRTMQIVGMTTVPQIEVQVTDSQHG